jgi:hypothetical protein
MLVVVSDTHGREGHGLKGWTLKAVRGADLVLHAGDFVTEAVLNAFEGQCDLRAVYGNNDPPEVRERVPETRVVRWEGLRIAMAHGHEHGAISRSYLGRQANADLVVVGHSHRPEFLAEAVPPVLNPGSHAAPRWYRPGYAELECDGDGHAGRILEPDGTLVESFRL